MCIHVANLRERFENEGKAFAFHTNEQMTSSKTKFKKNQFSCMHFHYIQVLFAVKSATFAAYY